MQYDAAINATTFQTALNATAINAETKSVIADILNLDVSNSQVVASTYNNQTFNVVVNPTTGAIETPNLVYFENLGNAGQNVTVHIPTLLNSAPALIFDTAANVTVTIGNSSAVTSQAAVEGATATRVVVGGSGNDTITITDNVNTHVDAGAGNNTITTAGGNDTVVLNGGTNTVHTGAGNDVVFAGNGINTIDGGSGYDVVNVGNLANYTASVSNGTVVLNSSTSGQETLTNVQFVASVNGTETLAIVGDQNQATAIRLYEAVLGRDADASGTQFWVSQAQAGVSTTSIANQFLNSVEYNAAHTTPLSDGAFIQSLYQHALGRAADTDGLVFWAQQLATGHSRADVAVGIVGSVEAQNHDTGVIVVTGQV
ncbi:hypothetical protein NS383_10315 [Pseudomonas oryzihabitans]|nr:hypothetical protein NS383_10315 [Pseudomonas psychrotolerans]